MPPRATEGATGQTPPLAFSSLSNPLNTAKDSLGCIGLGENKIKGQIINSTKYFHKLMTLLKSSTTPIKLIIE